MKAMLLTCLLLGLCLTKSAAGAGASAAGAPYHADTPIREVIEDPVWAGCGRLLFPVDDGYMSGRTLGEMGLAWYSHIDPAATVEILNTLKSRAADGQTVFYDIYTDEEKAADPAMQVRLDGGVVIKKGKKIFHRATIA